jgi:hypothetical protein
MSQDVAQWLAEVKALKQQVADLQAQLQQAYLSTDNWQRRYEIEAQQRRVEVQQAQQTFDALQQEMQRLQGNVALPDTDPGSALHWEIDPSLPPEELRRRLGTVLQERDRLAATLAQEQASHEETRRNLTTALGDAIALLSKEKPPEAE